MKKRTSKFNPVWLIAPAIVIVWMLCVYYINGIYPFGVSSLLSYDLYNGGLPDIYQVYDAWHSGDFTRLIYDFTTAAGFQRVSLLSIIQPRYIYSLFFSREFLPRAIDLFFVFEFGLIGFASSYSFSKIFPKLSPMGNVLISVMYAFNGFNMMYLTNIDWLDVVALFPLLMLFAVNLLEGKNKIPFFFVLSYLMIIHTYMAFFVVISLIIFGGLYIYIVVEKEKRKKAVLNLGIGAAASLVASSYSIINCAIGVLSSARFGVGSYVRNSNGVGESVSGFSGILKVPAEIDIVAVFMFLGTALAIASLIVLWIHFKKHKESRKYTVFFTISILLLICQVACKATMLYWHLGSYQFFPFRNGYIVSFFCCCIIGFYYSLFGDFEGLKTKYNVINFLTIIPAFLCGIIVASYVGVFSFNMKGFFNVLTISVENHTDVMAYPYACLALSLVACFLLIKLISFKTLRNIITFLLVFIMIGLNSVCLIFCGIAEDRSGIYKKEIELSDVLTKNDELSRVCNIDACLLDNYPYVSGVYSVSNWIHSISGNQLKSFADLGLAVQFTTTRDMGGTVFSRALLRFTETVSASELNNRLYSKTGETASGIKCYSDRFLLPAGICADNTIANISADDYKNLFEYQNDIYSAMGGEGDLFNKVEYKSVTKKVKQEKYYEKENESNENELLIKKKGVVTAKFILDVNDESVLYIHSADKNQPISFRQLTINGKPFHVYDGTIPENAGSYNKTFSTRGYDRILELGVFENETVEITITYSEASKTDERAVMYLMDMGKMQKLCEKQSGGDYSVNKSQFTLNVENKNKDGFAFIPLTYNENWGCTVNGKEVEPICVLGTFMGIKLESGNNVISLKYSPIDTYITMIVLLVSFLVGLALLLVERKIKFPKAIQTIAFAVFTLIFAGGMTVLYILPVGYNAVTALLSLFK